MRVGLIQSAQSQMDLVEQQQLFPLELQFLLELLLVVAELCCPAVFQKESPGAAGG
jgi:hypothetical protein